LTQPCFHVMIIFYDYSTLANKLPASSLQQYEAICESYHLIVKYILRIGNTHYFFVLILLATEVVDHLLFWWIVRLFIDNTVGITCGVATLEVFANSPMMWRRNR